MSARIAPEPVISGFGTTADHNSRKVAVNTRTPDSQKPPAQRQLPIADAQRGQSEQAAEPVLPPLPRPPAPPGAAFAVALISGQLPPKPTSERELQMRLGSADLPAQGSLALHDRLV